MFTDSLNLPKRVVADFSSAADWRAVLECIPVAAYTCDAMGRLTYFNPVAAAIWGRTAMLRDTAERYCGSYRLYSTEGARMPNEKCWMARALSEGRAYNGFDVVIERLNGTRTLGMAYANPLRNPRGAVIGGVNLVIARTIHASIPPVLSSQPDVGIVEDAAIAITEITLGLFARLAWPAETFN